LPSDQRITPVHLDETVSLDVALVDEVEPEPVGEVEKLRGRRVVRGANRVDVMSLHKQQFGLEQVRWNGAPEVGMMFVAVHPAQDDRSIVDREHAIGDAH